MTSAAAAAAIVSQGWSNSAVLEQASNNRGRGEQIPRP